MLDIQTEIKISAPISKVSNYASNPDHAPSWYVNIKSVEWKTPRPAQVGTKVAFVAEFLGKTIAYVYEFVEFEPGSKLVMRTAEGPFPMETTYTWQQLDEHTTHMTLRNRGVPKGFSKLLAPFLKMMMKKANRKDLRKLKALMEQ